MIGTRTLIGALLKFIWPWFSAQVLPRILNYLSGRVGDWLARHFQDLRSQYGDRMNSRATGAEGKAADAERKAREALTDEERIRQEAVARVWREVAEQFRAENAALRAKLDEMEARESKSLIRELTGSHTKLEGQDGELQLTVGDRKHRLPGPGEPE